MDRANEIQNAYKTLGKGFNNFYDGMITYSSVLGKAVCRLVWDLDGEKSARYLELALSGIPEGFDGKLLEVPVGTGVLTMPVYQRLPQAEITCLDYSPDMMANARKRAEAMGVGNVSFVQGDVGALPFADGSFDIVLSLNGFHAFPDKDKAFSETCRVLKPGGLFCGCFFIQGENRRSDWFIDHLYVPKGYFTPPFETKDSLRKRLEGLYAQVKLDTVEAMACFTCRKWDSFRGEAAGPRKAGRRECEFISPEHKNLRRVEAALPPELKTGPPRKRSSAFVGKRQKSRPVDLPSLAAADDPPAFLELVM